MRISDWSSDVCSSDLASPERAACGGERRRHRGFVGAACGAVVWVGMAATVRSESDPVLLCSSPRTATATACSTARSEEHTSELQSLMRISYAVVCLKKKN